LQDELLLSNAALLEFLQASLKKGLPFRVQVKGFSMSPFIKNGDVVTVSPLKNSLPRFGDIVAFIHPVTKKLIIHREVARKGNFYLITGDNTKKLDSFVPRENILGCITRLERRGKRMFFGLGPERLLIAFLVRENLLLPLLNMTHKFLTFFKN